MIQIKNKLDYYPREECMTKFCKDLKEHATKVINYEKLKIIPITNEESSLHHKQKVCYICKKEFSADDNNFYKNRDHVIILENIEVRLIVFVT